MTVTSFGGNFKIAFETFSGPLLHCITTYRSASFLILVSKNCCFFATHTLYFTNSIFRRGCLRETAPPFTPSCSGANPDSLFASLSLFLSLSLSLFLSMLVCQAATAAAAATGGGGGVAVEERYLVHKSDSVVRERKRERKRLVHE